jgi:hypothetical protein
MAQGSYVTVAELKASRNLTGQTFADADLTLAIDAASREIDDATGRRFYLDQDATQVRYYTPEAARRLMIDDCAVLASVAVDRAGTGVYQETWTNGVEYVAEPFNAPADFRPYESIVIRYLSGKWFPVYIQKSVQVTGQFGWAVCPQNIKAATSILAARLLLRVREAPFGVVAFGTEGAAVRLSRTDPDVYSLVQGWSRHAPLI